MKSDIAASITATTLEKLEAGTKPWVQPWRGTPISRPLRPCGSAYRGINTVMLWMAAQAVGYMIHPDLPPFNLMDPFTQFILDNETWYNNELFWGAMRDLDQHGLAERAGFDRAQVKFDTAPMAVMKFAAQAAGGYSEAAASAVAEREFTAGEYAPGGGWEVLIGRKPQAAAKAV